MHFVLLFSISVRFGVLLAIMLHCDKLAQTVWIVGLHVVSGGMGRMTVWQERAILLPGFTAERGAAMEF